MKPDSLSEVVHSFSSAGSTTGKLTVLLLAVTLISTPAFAQFSSKPTAPKTGVVPNLVRFSGTATDNGNPLNHISPKFLVRTTLKRRGDLYAVE